MCKKTYILLYAIRVVPKLKNITILNQILFGLQKLNNVTMCNNILGNDAKNYTFVINFKIIHLDSSFFLIKII